MKVNKLRKLFLLAVVLIFGVGGILAQTGTSSPYSRFGIGELKNKNVNARLRGMGGLSNAIISNRFVNPSNPASYSGFDSLSFLFNAGLEMNSITYRTNTLTEKITTLSSIALT